MRARPIAGVLLIAAAVAAAAALALIWRPALDPITPPAAGSFYTDRVTQGRWRARAADAVRHALFQQHHAGCPNRNRPLVEGGVRPRHARRRQSRWAIH